ncbi:unnamed protein product [Linum tenue]|uniref:Uncharacterized protein n=1 Tax=Linum tenue TaxID=586396 RepID=A0AAV0PZJ2_9ROSI|nr:unnamed protein product [Linum tenue]
MVPDGRLRRGPQLQRLGCPAEHVGRVRTQPVLQPGLLRHIAGGRVQHPHDLHSHEQRRLGKLPEPDLRGRHQHAVPQRAAGPGRLQQPLYRVQDQ